MCDIDNLLCYISRMSSSRPLQMLSFVEVLEARIAPAVILVGNDPTSVGYDEAPFVGTNVSPDPSVRELFDGSSSHYYLNLAAGDVVKFYDDADGYKNFIGVNAGRAFAFFFDANGDKTVQKNELSGFAVGQGTNLAVSGSVNGDVVGNLDGRTQQLSPVSTAGPGHAQNLLGVAVSRLFIDGDVNGRIITGGKLSNVDVKNVEQITTSSDGTYTFDWSGGADGPTPATGKALLQAYLPAAGGSGGNISGVTVSVLEDNTDLGARGGIIAGIGGAGGAGGSISGVTVLSDPDGFLILAGNGGDGPRGGKGGDVRNLLVHSVPDALDQADLIEVGAGRGGTALGAGQAGGAGGFLAGVTIGYNPVGSALVETPLADVVQLYAGRGGNGDIGGSGGAINNAKVALDVDAAGPEFTATAGDGGDGVRRDGNGGSISGLVARNFNLEGANDDSMVLAAGNGGVGGGGSGAGGSISQVTVFANALSIAAGDGSSGTIGGRGGSISRIVLDVLPNTDWIESMQILAGDGGTAASGAGGSGGSVASVTAASIDLVDPTPTTPSRISAGDGGDSAAGRGGAGGGISACKITETVPTSAAAVILFAGGTGGDGATRGGAGGAIANVSFQGIATSVLIAAGGGGDAVSRGSGGAGGAVNAAVVQVVGGTPSGPATVSAGNGGDAAGTSGRGGAGGRVASATVIYEGSAEVRGGEGGSDGGGGGSTSALGSGGAVSRVLIQALAGNATVVAGAAGTSVSAAIGAAGGSLSSIAAVASGNVLIAGGDGKAGGAGGSVSDLSWFGVSAGRADALSAPAGTVTIQGGEGSLGARTAGAGGSLNKLIGYASATPTAETLLAAGDGNGGVAGARAAAGGSISGVSLFGGVGEIEIVAGQGGSIDALTAGAKGGAGGRVANISVAAGLDVKTIAAGDGGDAPSARGRGGIGGSVTAVNVEGDIGVRNGQNFGIDTMGGVFAGRGGSGDPAALGTLGGRSGDVVNVTAAAISSIVAGRPSSSSPSDFSLVNLLDRVVLRGLAAPTVQLNGAFDLISAPGATPPRVGFAEANLVGAVAGTLSVADANVFKIDNAGSPAEVPAAQLQMRAAEGSGFEYFDADWQPFRPLDGFVAAQQVSANKNFIPQALLTFINPRDQGSLAFSDYRNNFNANA